MNVAEGKCLTCYDSGELVTEFGPAACPDCAGEPGAVGAKGVQLRVQCLLAAIGLVPSLNGGGERIERKRKTPAGRVDGAPFGHSR